MDQEIYLLLVGVGVGCVYALGGLGIVTLFSGSGVLNFAQGELMVISALVTAVAIEDGVPYLLAIILAVGVVAVIGAVAGWLFSLPVRRASYDLDLVIVGTIGLAFFLSNAAGEVLGREPQLIESPLDGSLAIGDLSVPYHYLLLIAATVAVYFVVRAIYERSDLGLRLRAVALDTEAARLSGVRIGRTFVVTWVIASVVGAIGGALIASVSLVNSELGVPLTISGFAAAMIGGLRNPLGTLIGGILIGVAETYAATYLDEALRQAVPPAVILLVLLLRPSGLFGGRSESVRTV